jgi:ParB family chromosome partitioning protein
MEAIDLAESKRLRNLEAVVERGRKSFVEVGMALDEIRQKRLYRADYPTFQDYLEKKWGWGKSYGYMLIESANAVKSLPPEMSTIVDTEGQARELVKVPTEKREAVVRAAEASAMAKGKPPTARDFREAAGKLVVPAEKPPAPQTIEEPTIPHVSRNSGENEWYTPPEFIQAAQETLGCIDLDPASCEHANQTVGASTIFTKEDNGLSKKWSGKVWMNPPYAQPLCAQFCERVSSAYDNGEIEAAIVLVNNATETKWFQRMLKSATAVCFPEGRIRFHSPEGEKGAPLQGQALVYFGECIDMFRKQFEEFGKVTLTP